MAKSLTEILASTPLKRRLKIRARAAMLAKKATNQLKSNNSQ